jgi:F-type H+-transporting ATPase subunit epsilon
MAAVAGKLHFDLVSPERLLMSEEVDQVVVPGSEGDFGVLANHAPFVSTLRPGVVSVMQGAKTTDKVFVRGGFAEVTPQGLTILAEEAIHFDDFDGAAVDAQIKNAEEDVADAKTDAVRVRAQETLDRLRELKGALGK